MRPRPALGQPFRAAEKRVGVAEPHAGKAGWVAARGSPRTLPDAHAGAVPLHPRASKCQGAQRPCLNNVPGSSYTIRIIGFGAEAAISDSARYSPSVDQMLIVGSLVTAHGD